MQQYAIDGALRRRLAVLRMRLSLFDRTLRELVLDEHGVRVLKLEERVLEMLKGDAQLSRGAVPDDERRPAANAPEEA